MTYCVIKSYTTACDRQTHVHEKHHLSNFLRIFKMKSMSVGSTLLYLYVV